MQATTEQVSTKQVATEPEVYVVCTEPLTLKAEGEPTEPKSWLMDSSCMSHLSPNRSNFISYTPYDVPVTICDTRFGNRSCDWSGDLSPTFSEFVYVCLCLFTYVWSLDLFWKLYIVLMLRELTSLSFNIDFNTLILSLSV